MHFDQKDSCTNYRLILLIYSSLDQLFCVIIHVLITSLRCEFQVYLRKRRMCSIIQGYSKSSIHFQKFILQKLLMLNPCPVYGWKGNLSKFWYRWSEAEHHWGCGCCYLWHAVTSVGRAGLLIWHLPRHTWGSHRVLVRCENNFDSYPSVYI
jgi:hypothetical protein